MNINNYWNSVCVNDPTKCVERANQKTFTTITPAQKAGGFGKSCDVWESFWFKKDLANTQLLFYASQGFIKEIKALIGPMVPFEEQAEILYSNPNGLNALHVAIKHNREQIVRILLETDKSIVSVPTFNESRFSPLHIAVLEQLPMLVQLLIREYHADVDADDGYGNTPLHYAA